VCVVITGSGVIDFLIGDFGGINVFPLSLPAI
jgi:hypothetical protein